MAATRFLLQAAATKQHPRARLIQQLNTQGSQFARAAVIGESPTAISRAMVAYRIAEIKRYLFCGHAQKVQRKWMREEDLMRRHDWQELR